MRENCKLIHNKPAAPTFASRSHLSNKRGRGNSLITSNGHRKIIYKATSKTNNFKPIKESDRIIRLHRTPIVSNVKTNDGVQILEAKYD